jgi:hypothetical protein
MLSPQPFQRPFRRVIDGVERNRQESVNRRRIDEQSGSSV